MDPFFDIKSINDGNAPGDKDGPQWLLRSFAAVMTQSELIKPTLVLLGTAHISSYLIDSRSLATAEAIPHMLELVDKCAAYMAGFLVEAIYKTRPSAMVTLVSAQGITTHFATINHGPFEVGPWDAVSIPDLILPQAMQAAFIERQ